jgi:cysteinyl-tRNA synthetase
MKYLGKQFDVHVAGEDLRSTHHPNEIAQSEGATGTHPFVKYWVHGAFLTVDSGRMGKSKGNAYTLTDLENKGFSAMDLRYFYFTGHYRKPLNFTFEALSAAQQARSKLHRAVMDLEPGMWGEYSNEGKRMMLDFEKALTLDLNMPEVLAVVWEAVRSKKIESAEKMKMLQTMERVLGLGLFDNDENIIIPDEIETLIQLRQVARDEGNYGEADRLRVEIEMRGFEVEDASSGYRLRRKGSVS